MKPCSKCRRPIPLFTSRWQWGRKLFCCRECLTAALTDEVVESLEVEQ